MLRDAMEAWKESRRQRRGYACPCGVDGLPAVLKNCLPVSVCGFHCNIFFIASLSEQWRFGAAALEYIMRT